MTATKPDPGLGFAVNMIKYSLSAKTRTCTKIDKSFAFASSEY